MKVITTEMTLSQYIETMPGIKNLDSFILVSPIHKEWQLTVFNEGEYKSNCHQLALFELRDSANLAAHALSEASLINT